MIRPEHIRDAFRQALPGWEAHKTMMNYIRQSPEEARQSEPPPRLSAVMMLIYPKNDHLHTLFMLRPDNQGVHSGQLSFPGGKKEEDDIDMLHTALRESQEEVGIDPSSIEVLGPLSELYIPPSHFIVQPFVGLLNEQPHFQPSQEEVVELLEEPLSHFLREDLIQKKEIHLPKYNVRMNTPFFDVQGKTLWGATAMMVQEFRMIMGYFR